MDGDPNKIYRLRLYSFASNEKENAIELRIYAFNLPENGVTASHLAGANWSDMKPETMRATPGCEVYWKRDGEGFRGYMKPTCRVNSQRLGKTIVITDDLKLTADEIWINDQAKDEAGGYVFGNKSGEHHKLKRVHTYEGWAVLKVGDTGDDKKDYVVMRGLKLHDQGQILRLVKPDGEQTKYSLQLAHLTEQSTKAAVFVFKLFEDGQERAINYVWTQPGAERIGMNLRWFQSGMTLKK